MIRIFEGFVGFVDIVTEEYPLMHSEQYGQIYHFPVVLRIYSFANTPGIICVPQSSVVQ